MWKVAKKHFWIILYFQCVVIMWKKFREINVLGATFILISCRINHGPSETWEKTFVVKANVNLAIVIQFRKVHTILWAIFFQGFCSTFQNLFEILKRLTYILKSIAFLISSLEEQRAWTPFKVIMAIDWDLNIR